MNLIFLSPGFPSEMPDFVRGLSDAGVRVVGIGDQAENDLPEKAARSLSAYYRADFSDPAGVLKVATEVASQIPVDRVESLWEPLMILAARLREMLGVPGMQVVETVPFRDKEAMKQLLDTAGIRTPHHYRCKTIADVHRAVERIGFPLIIKPIAGAGSADTYRINDRSDLDGVLPMVRYLPQVSVEEFVEAEEFTFDTVCARGQILFYNICWYRPRPLVGKQHEWVSQQTVVLRDPDVEYLAAGREMGRKVIEAMDFGDGFTHMEWYLKPDGEVVFGEIAARPPGGRTVDAMNFASDIDLFRWWGEAVVHGQVPEPLERKYNCVNIFKRANGVGRIQRYQGLEPLLAEFGEHVVTVELNPIGSPRRDWRQTLIGDGMVVIRHPDLQTATHIADRFATDLQLFAG
jgi:biotin carboxylase